jgi:hypothetical protein
MKLETFQRFSLTSLYTGIILWEAGLQGGGQSSEGGVGGKGMQFQAERGFARKHRQTDRQAEIACWRERGQGNLKRNKERKNGKGREGGWNAAWAGVGV